MLTPLGIGSVAGEPPPLGVPPPGDACRWGKSRAGRARRRRQGSTPRGGALGKNATGDGRDPSHGTSESRIRRTDLPRAFYVCDGGQKCNLTYGIGEKTLKVTMEVTVINRVL